MSPHLTKHELRVEWGYGASRWYTNGYLGLNNRTKGFSDEGRFQAEFGYWLLKRKLLASAKLATVQSFYNGDPSGASNGLFANNVEYISPQIGLSWEYKSRWGVSGLVAGAFQGANALAAPSISVGLYRKLSN